LSDAESYPEAAQGAPPQSQTNAILPNLRADARRIQLLLWGGVRRLAVAWRLGDNGITWGVALPALLSETGSHRGDHHDQCR
jgi:hypothetical protein